VKLNSDYEIKQEVWRYLSGRWNWTRSYFLRQQGYPWLEISRATGHRGESSARLYVKRAVEHSHLSELFQHLSIHARRVLINNRIWKDMPTHLAVDKARQMIAEIKDGKYPCGRPVRKKILHEILNVLDDLE
jgi:hypothetical protein